MKIFTIVFLFFTSQVSAHRFDRFKKLELHKHISQDSNFKKRNSLFLEFLGTNGLYSVNYERKFISSNSNNFLAIKLGTTPFSNLYPGLNSFVNNIMLGYNFGSKLNLIEVGAGLGTLNIWGSKTSFGMGALGAPTLPIKERVNTFEIYPVLGVSYRYQSKSGFLFKTTATTYYSNKNNGRYISNFNPWLGVSIGWSF